MAISTAIDQTRVSRVVGYKVKSGIFSPATGYLPQRIAILGEANTANQATIDNSPFEFINAKEVGDKYGYGSPLHQMARILRPASGNVLGGIPTIIYPQLEDVAATGTKITISITVATTVTENARHFVVISGRNGIDGSSYGFDVVVGEDAAAIQTKILDVIANVLGCPVTAADNVGDIDFESKWAGLSSEELNIELNVGDKPAGVVYAEIAKVDGTGVTAITDSLALFGNNWNTILINPYGPSVFSDLETFNGTPDPTTPTGRYLATVFKPFVALYGSNESDKDAVVAVTNVAARKAQVTNVHCPAPNSNHFTWESACNMAVTAAPIMQNFPHIDNSNKSYNDLAGPSDENIGDFSDYDARDFMVKKGSSTVDLNNGKYTVQDFITTYTPDGENPPKFRFVRDLNIDWNVGFNWKIIMERDIQDKTIIEDTTPSDVDEVITPKQIRQLLSGMFDDLARLALITDPDFSRASVVIGINETNPARLDIFFRYKRTSPAHIVSNDAEVDFNFTI